MSVNLSRRQLLAPNFTARIVSVMQETGVAATSLVFEITESSVFHDLADAARVLSELRGLGAEIHLDDFGSGYSSLSHLSRLPLSAMKLDYAFLRDASGGAEGARAYAAVVQLARAYGLRLVAEGVETDDQLAMLRGLGVDFAQGYLLGRPVAAAEAEASILRSAGSGIRD
jgi:EAL domain-containing protein (putative c-di-GMP-specific phosphodiesterase class I)